MKKPFPCSKRLVWIARQDLPQQLCGSKRLQFHWHTPQKAKRKRDEKGEKAKRKRDISLETSFSGYTQITGSESIWPSQPQDSSQLQVEGNLHCSHSNDTLKCDSSLICMVQLGSMAKILLLKHIEFFKNLRKNANCKLYLLLKCPKYWKAFMQPYCHCWNNRGKV